MTELVASAEFPAAPESAGEARRLVEAALRRRAWSPEDIQIALLLTSEVVTNAVVHARTGLSLRLRLAPDMVRVEVDDEGMGAAVLTVAGVDDLRGRGLQIVDSLADRWGDEHRSNGRHRVWFELRMHA
jgi:anti-sigma regulatory factor (Ser/Thr protein kinase)